MNKLNKIKKYYEQYIPVSTIARILIEECKKENRKAPTFQGMRNLVYYYIKKYNIKRPTIK